jgi:hypothetical protein
MLVWECNQETKNLLLKVKDKHKRLAEANVALSFNDGKAFTGGRFNWGKVVKFSPLAKLWHPSDATYDFHISLPADSWHSLLSGDQREAWLDLHLTRCQVEYVPVMIEVNGKKFPEKDEWGRTKYTDEIKRDEEGNPKWRVSPLDLMVFVDNVSRYGLWSQDLVDFKETIDARAISGKEGLPG